MEGKHELRVNAPALALASAIIMGIADIICALFAFLLPGAALQLLGWMFHLVNMEKFVGGVTLTFGGFLLGFVQVVVYTYLFVLLWGWLYNKIAK